MSGNMEKVLRLMADKKASDVYLSANTPILIKINGQMLQLSDQSLTPAQPRQLLTELLTPQQLEELDDTGELNLGIGMAGLGSFRLSAFRQRGSIAAVIRCIPIEIPSLESLNLPPLLSHAGAGKARPDPDGRRHRHRQEHDAGVDARMAQPADGGPHPDDRRSDRVPVHQQELGGQPARGRPRHRNAADGAEERAAPGARLHPDRRNPRPRDDDLGDLVCAVGPPGAGHAARQQQLPRAGPHPVVLHAGVAPCAAEPTWRRACAPSSRSGCCAPRPAAACRRWKSC